MKQSNAMCVMQLWTFVAFEFSKNLVLMWYDQCKSSKESEVKKLGSDLRKLSGLRK